MRHTILLALVLAACEPIHGSAYSLHYDVPPRKILVQASDAVRAMHYSIVAIESPDVYHNVMLAFADATPAKSPDALLIQISTQSSIACPMGGCISASGNFIANQTPGTDVAVTPLAFRGGHEVPASPQLRAQAQQLMLSIYDRSRDFRELRRFF